MDEDRLALAITGGLLTIGIVIAVLKIGLIGSTGDRSTSIPMIEGWESRIMLGIAGAGIVEITRNRGSQTAQFLIMLLLVSLLLAFVWIENPLILGPAASIAIIMLMAGSFVIWLFVENSMGSDLLDEPATIDRMKEHSSYLAFAGFLGFVIVL